MSNRHIDAILDGHRATPDNTGAMGNPDPSRRLCWRCLTNPSGDGASGVCDRCRQILLDEVYEPRPATSSTTNPIPPYSGTLEISLEDLGALVARIADQLQAAMDGLAEALQSIAQALIEVLESTRDEITQRLSDGEEWMVCDPEWLVDSLELGEAVGLAALRVRANTEPDPGPASAAPPRLPREDLAALGDQPEPLQPDQAPVHAGSADGTAEATGAPSQSVSWPQPQVWREWYDQGVEWCGRVPLLPHPTTERFAGP